MESTPEIGMSGLSPAYSFVQLSEIEVHLEWSMKNIALVAMTICFCLLVVIVNVLYWSRGFRVISSIIVYLVALSTMTLTVKSVFYHHSFNYPKFVTLLHFFTCLLSSFAIMVYRKVVRNRELAVPSWNQFFTMVLPTALSFAASIALGNYALIYSNAAFVEMVSSSTPLFTILVVMMLGLPFDLRLIAPVMVVCIGVASCAAGELKISWMGLILTTLSSLTRGLRSTLQQNLLNPARTQAFNRHITPLDPVELLAWMSIPSILVLFIWSVLTEGWAPYQRFTQPGWMPVLYSILITCVNACILNVANLFVIKDLGAVACQLAGQLKSILIMLGAVAVFSEPISTMQIIGFVLVFLGVFWYNRKEAEIKGITCGNGKTHQSKCSKKASFVRSNLDKAENHFSFLSLFGKKDGETDPLLDSSGTKTVEP